MLLYFGYVGLGKTLNGTYIAVDTVGEEITFKADTFTWKGNPRTSDIKGTYKIDDGKIKFVFSINSTEYIQEFDFKKGGNLTDWQLLHGWV
ncbi:hypothetical protein FACS1894132_08100 [Clostridia bacterium]|nr:hypothetical protein FACS1894132_08100 [Clostridia bacterium]